MSEWGGFSGSVIRVSSCGGITKDQIDACAAILRRLPEWFGDAKAVVGYLNDLHRLDTHLA